ncbi:MAG: scavenger receptor cysteine-rich domain-containing protein, partial [Endozoicomonadaceae bacterium]|nr:scavenger receptor cysteine-rich domain-containing protein [Endozoicomonadaceae bacterium]
GNKTTVIQKNVNANFITSYSHIPNKNISEVQNEKVTTFSTNFFTQISPVLETVRLTNASDNSEQRSVVQNNGRLEIYRNNKWQVVCESTLPPKSAHAACKSLGYIEANDEATRVGLRKTLTLEKLDSDPVHINRTCTGYERHLEQCTLAGADINDSCPRSREALLSCSEKPIVHYPALPFRLTDYTSGDFYRLDTTNIGTGRLEYNDNGSYMTVCTLGFSAENAQAACFEMGFRGGGMISPNQQPLGEEVGHIMRLWSCDAFSYKLSLCPESTSNIDILRGCSHETDVILRCNKHPWPFIPVRLTDRNSVDENRADTSMTGLGRLEFIKTHRNKLEYTAFCPEGVSSEAIKVICKGFGFDGGRRFYLPAKPLPSVINAQNEEVIGMDLSCGNNNMLQDCAVTLGFSADCRQPSGNLILFCTNTNTSQIQLIPKDCPHTPVTTTLFSGSYNLVTDCNTKRCPLKQWDDYSTEVSANIYNLCKSTQQQNTKNPDDWLKIWNSRCAAVKGHCDSCHLPYEQILGLITDNNQPGEILLISRQTYPDNTESLNGQGLILLNRLSGNRPQVLRSAKETLAADACPVNHIMTEQQLLGLYSGGNNTNSQLLWLSPEPSNNVYYAKTLSESGKPLLITDSSVFIQDTNSSIIRQYPLDKTVVNDAVMFNINNRVYKNIIPPERINNILAAVLKNNQLHLATTLIHDKTHLALTNGQGAHDAYLISYNISENSWSCITEPVNSINAKNIHNYNMVVDDDSQVQFLIRELTSIPESGGCISLSGRMPLKLMALPIESLENSTQPINLLENRTESTNRN